MIQRPVDPTGEGGVRDARPHPAATVVLLRPGPGGPEVLLIHRPATMAFGPGLHVFPGGRVDPEDAVSTAADHALGGTRAARALGDNLTPSDALAVHRAALRELREEAGITLDDIDRLVPIAHWTTPPVMPRRFSTWFFVADLPLGAMPMFAADEVAAHRWVTPSLALEQVAAGEIEMWAPTTSVLQRLIETGATTAAEVAQQITMKPTAPPRIVGESPVLVRFAFGAMGGLPGRNGETTLIGDRQVVLVDPGDPSDEALGLIERVVKRREGVIDGIVLTRTDPDHAAAALSQALAIPPAVRIFVAPGAGRYLPYATQEATDGERLPTDLDVRVRLGPPGSGRLEVVTG
jgi:8-oxo-dGTP pyrophosphatase MutT (NUDIX family)